MNIRRRSLRTTAFAILIAASAGSAARAQQTETIGPPALRDFELKGERTTPPAQPAPAASEATRTSTPSTSGQTPTTGTASPAPTAPAEIPARRVRERQSAAPAPRQAVPVIAPAPAPQAIPTVEAPTANAPASVEPAPTPVPAAPTTAQPQQPATAPAPATESGWSWWWLALPVALGVIALVAFLRRRRTDETEVELAAPEPPAAEEIPAAEPIAPVRPVPAAPRPRLEVEFVPERAAATEREATIAFELLVRNIGDAEARNIRIDSRMFNASGEREIDAFLRGEIHDESGSPHVTIPPGEVLRLSAGLVLPKNEVREIELQGRRLFVPVVAINVAYDWADGGRGRTSRSWLVGREAEQASGKMGGFRLDQGPRIYRSIGQRPTKLAHVA